MDAAAHEVALVQDNRFGRRRAFGTPTPRPRQTAPALSPRAEAFRQSLKVRESAASSEFADWRRARRARRLVAWALGLALMSPGGLCFLIQAPAPASIALEVAGVMANLWLRRERRRHLREIARWEPSPS